MNKKNFATLILALLAIGSTIVGCSDGYKDTNIAWQDEQVRFTVISDGVIRMEWSADSLFCDLPTLMSSERNYPKVQYKVNESNGVLNISTSKMTLTYKIGSGRFTADNLTINSAEGLFSPSSNEQSYVWHPGDVQKNNLKGTYRTLDGYDGNRYYAWDYKDKEGRPMPLEDGLLATDGWTLIDDSENLLFTGDPNNVDPEKPMAWVEERPAGERQDWYFLSYGHDYKAALYDYTLFAGRIPLPPRFTFGYWWSRYWRYSAEDLRFLVKSMKEWDNPLDVLVIDMDWHYSDGIRGGWTGYTWDETIFPDPAGLLSEFDEQGIQVTLNLHPADGVSSVEEHYADFAKWLGKEPVAADQSPRDTLQWCSSDQKYMDGWMNTIIRPLENQGVDFWWLDWQQGLNDKQLPTLSNTFWLNYYVFTDMARNRDKRPLLYHRWGGLGNHRYQIGFSGDSYSTWASLEFQPYFNSTASNVLYGYWSHDLGGHMLGIKGAKLDQELYIRWMQLGLYLPIMRTHSTNDVEMNKEPWALATKENGELIASLCRQREALVPYTYTAARQAYETGISICRPMYYDYPDTPEAYSNKTQYMFGDQLLIAPIVKPMDNDGLSRVNVWLPSGTDWYEMSTGELLKGGQTIERAFTIDQYPAYAKAGTILPTYSGKNNQSVVEEDLYLQIIPGSDVCSGRMYEDAGNDKQYATRYAFTEFTYKDNKFCIGARKGEYDGKSNTRTFHISIPATSAPAQVLVDGKVVDAAFEDGLIKVSTGSLNPDVEHIVEIK